MATVIFKGSRAEVSRIVLQLAQILGGSEPDQNNISKGFNNALGFAVLSDVKEAFLTKATGGTDEAGIKWPPLKPRTIANRRVGPRDIRQNPEIAEREKIRKRETKKALQRYRLSLPEGEARRRAAIVGGQKATSITGKTKVETLGGRHVEILRDTGILLNSLSPGTLSGTEYNRPTTEGGEEQIFEQLPGELAVGTNVLYARTHQRGDPSRNIPARPFLPVNVPQVWWDRWIAIANKALVVSAKQLFQQPRRTR